MTMSKAMNHLPIQIAPIKPLQDWLGQRALPDSHGGDFRIWMKAHRKTRQAKNTAGLKFQSAVC